MTSADPELKPMKYLSVIWLACLFLCSCQSTYEVGLKSLVEVANAKRVAVCQSGDLDRVSMASTLPLVSGKLNAVVLPKNSTAQAIVGTLPPKATGTVFQGLARPRFPANRVVAPFRDPHYLSHYDPIPPMREYDLVIQVCQRSATPSTGGMGGYYNAAAGAYIPMGDNASGPGGYFGSYEPVLRTLTFSSILDVYVYRGTDGKCLGNFYLSYFRNAKKRDDLTTAQEHIEATAQTIVRRIFGN